MKKVGMGGVDVKLFAALGAWFGVYMLPYILVLASIAGIVVGGLYLLCFNKPKTTPIAFGPFLCIAGVVFLKDCN